MIWVKSRRRRTGRLIVNAGICLLFLMLACLTSSGCKAEPAVGDIDDLATVAYISMETQDDGFDGIVYRQINRFDAFLAESKVPVLVVFYDSLAAINTQVIPMLEQMADDYDGQLKIAWIDANAEEALALSFDVERLPQFTVVVEAILKRSLVGFDDEGNSRVMDLLAPYLSG